MKTDPKSLSRAQTAELIDFMDEVYFVLLAVNAGLVDRLKNVDDLPQAARVHIMEWCAALDDVRRHRVDRIAGIVDSRDETRGGRLH